MKVFKIIIALAFIVAFSANDSMAQRKNRHLIAADQMYDSERYFVAIDKYKKAYSKIKRNKEEKARIAYRIAECYRHVNDVRRAKGAYKRAIRMNDVDKNPTMLLHYADILKALAKYEEAQAQYEAYVGLVPDDTLGIVGVESCKKAIEWLENPTNYQIENQKKINSKQSDFAPTYADKFYRSIIFTSAREGSTGDGEDEWTGMSFSDLYYSKTDNRGAWSTPVLADKKENVNTIGNEGAPWFNENFSTMYYTSCPNEDGKKSGCQIYVSARGGRSFGKGELVELGRDTSAVYAHPTLTKDELTIIFTSEQKKGFGGKDLYIATRASKGEKFGAIENLGAVINTPGDEMFPYLRNDSILYFSSTGHVGFGGLDIFKSVKVDGKWSEPENMRSPMNTNWDDFGITFHKEDEQGYFSSNRRGGRGSDDIYYFTNPPLKFSLSGTVKNNNTLQPIEGVRIRMTGSDGSSVVAKTDPKGFYSFSPSQVKPNTSYEMIIDLDDYFTKKVTESTVGVERSTDIVRDFMLNPIPDEPVILPDILYDLAKWDLKPQYQDSLQGLIETLDANETIVIELASHTDARGSDERNDVLSQKRAQSVVDYLILRGIDPDRLVAKGYGERVPRTLVRNVSKAGYEFKEGTVLTEEFIATLPDDKVREAAHGMNRRTEFFVLSKDFVPKEKLGDVSSSSKTVNIVVDPNDNSVDFVYGVGGALIVPCIMNGYNMQFAYIDRYDAFMISEKKALEMLVAGSITKEDFVGDAEKILGEGTIADRAKLIIKEVRVGSNVVKDVEFTVYKDQSVDLVFGEEALKQFGAFTIDEENFKITF